MYNDYISKHLTTFVIAMRKSVTKSQFYFYYLAFVYFSFAQVATLLFNNCIAGMESITDAMMICHLMTIGEETESPSNSPACQLSGTIFKMFLIIVIRLFILTIILTQFIGMVQFVRVNRLVSMAK